MCVHVCVCVCVARAPAPCLQDNPYIGLRYFYFAHETILHNNCKAMETRLNKLIQSVGDAKKALFSKGGAEEDGEGAVEAGGKGRKRGKAGGKEEKEEVNYVSGAACSITCGRMVMAERCMGYQSAGEAACAYLVGVSVHTEAGGSSAMWGMAWGAVLALG